MTESGFVKVLSAADLPPGSCREVSVAGKPVALFNVAGVVYATSNLCLHRGGPLGQGVLDGAAVMCPWHAWTWDVRTGENTANPALKMARYEARIEDGHIAVRPEPLP
jgi:nitrite reductase/ring-hydroxylating ferredoxin subunit